MRASLILAGGRATRLGGIDKAFLPLAGQPLIAHILARLTPQLCPQHAPRHTSGAKIAISANGDPARFASFGLPILPDHPGHAHAGPLAGILAGLTWAHSIGATALLTLPVDTPFFPPDLIARLTPAPAVATWRARQHHLLASWPTAALPALESFRATSPSLRIRDALTRLGATQIPFDTEPDPFLNINTPEDLAAAEKIILTRS